jgi:hypothetical protein
MERSHRASFTYSELVARIRRALRGRHFRRRDVVGFCGRDGVRVLEDVELLNELRAGGGQDSGLGGLLSHRAWGRMPGI